MACEECGGNGTRVRPGSMCGRCGANSFEGGVLRRRPAPSSPLRGKLLPAGVVAVVVLALAVTAVALYGGDDSGRGPSDGASGGRAGDDLGDLGGAPQRIAPTDLPPPAPSPSRATPKPPAGTEPPRNARGPAYSAWAGPGCTGGGLYREDGRFSDGDDGWYTVRTGGQRGDGCDGRFTAVPMSGSRTADGDSTATWSWYVGSGYRTCSIAVVVPESDRERDVAGEPTTYNVLSDVDDPDSVAKVFEIDQTKLRGSGLVVEKVPVHDQRLTVQLVDRGLNRGKGREGAHHAAAQMRAECRD